VLKHDHPDLYDTSHIKKLDVGDRIKVIPRVPHTYIDPMNFDFGTIVGLWVTDRTGSEPTLRVETRWYITRENMFQIDADLAIAMGRSELVDTDSVSLIDWWSIEDFVHVDHYEENKPDGQPVYDPTGLDLITCWTCKIESQDNAQTFQFTHMSRCGSECDKLHYDYNEEQRHCRSCRTWFHLRCIVGDPLDSNIIKSYVRRADQGSCFQANVIPIARGGPHGFAGNGAGIESFKEAVIQSCRPPFRFDDAWRPRALGNSGRRTSI
ncbi:hypothetical protein OG21DRAFT_1528411, partial [Imleria badia]